MQALSTPWIKADWALATKFIAGTTTSPTPLAQTGFNVAHHVADSPIRVDNARRLLRSQFPTAAKFLWLNQIHSNHVIFSQDYAENTADATISNDPLAIPVVMTADCLPIILGAEDGSAWAAIHAGWQGLYKNIIAQTVKKFPTTSGLAAWIGPCIRQVNYEVNQSFFQRFQDLDYRFAEFFLSGREGHYFADLPAIARLQLQDCGVREIADCGICSFADSRFFSYRRDGENAGRMATFIAVRENK